MGGREERPPEERERERLTLISSVCCYSEVRLCGLSRSKTLDIEVLSTLNWLWLYQITEFP